MPPVLLVLPESSEMPEVQDDRVIQALTVFPEKKELGEKTVDPVNLAFLELLEVQVSTEFKDPVEPKEKLEHQEPKVIQEREVSPEILDHLEKEGRKDRPEIAERGDSLDLQDQLDLQVDVAKLVQLETEECQESMAFQDLLVLPDLWVPSVILVQEDPKEIKDIKENQEIAVPLVTRVVKDRQEEREDQDLEVPKEPKESQENPELRVSSV